MRELAKSRLEEIQRLSGDLSEARKEMDNYKVMQLSLPEGVVKETAVYRTLQCQYTMLIQEAGQLRAGLEESRNILLAARQHHFSQLEEIR